MTVDLEPPSIPMVDFSLFLNGSTEDRIATAKTIVAAFRKYGFVNLTNHGVPDDLLKEAFSWSKKWFDLPYEKKMLAPHPDGFAVHRGYSYPGLEKVSQLIKGIDADEKVDAVRAVPDFKESYEIGSDQNPDQPNVFPPPQTLPGFQTFMQSLYFTLSSFSENIFSALSLGVSLPETYLHKFHTGHHNQLRLLHYPEIPAEVLESGRMVRIPAHCDWSVFTLLFQDDCGGLEIESPVEPGKFMHVEPTAGACLVNIGDLMARWSNDYLKSTSHRVSLPPLQDRYTGEQRMTRERYSIPFFVTTTPDAVIECLPTCVDDDNPAKYPPVTQKEYNILKASMQY